MSKSAEEYKIKDFKSWFREEFGELPITRNELLDLEDDIDILNHLLERKKEEVLKQKSLLDKYYASLNAWKIDDSEKMHEPNL